MMHPSPAVLRRCLLLLAFSSLSAFADDPSPMNVQLVKTGLYLIQGGGANSLVRFSQAGLILVDGKSPGAYRDFMSQVRKLNRLSDLPVRVLILTGADEDRSGDLPRFTSAKVVIVTHSTTKRGLDARAMDPSPKYVTFDDAYTIRMGGVEVELLQIGARREGGNTVVYFPGHKVVAVGDLYNAGTASDAAAWSSALGELLKLDFDTAVPSEGSPVTRADVVALKARLDAAR